MNKKQKKKALFAALTQSYASGNMMAIADAILSIQPKTKEVSTVLKHLKLENERVLVVVPHTKDSNLQLASRNIKSVRVAYADMINPYIILDHKKVLIAESGLQVIKDHFLKEHAAK
jgi:ribosomal protein L4